MSMSGQTSGGLPQYTDKDKTFLRSDLNTAIKKIEEAIGVAGSVSSVNGKVGAVVLKGSDIEMEDGNENTIAEEVGQIKTDIGELESVIIGSSASETILGYVVPKLTNDEIIQAYNGIVAGKNVYIVDSLDTLCMSVYSANNISGDAVINAIFNDKLILTYKEGDTEPTITAKSIIEEETPELEINLSTSFSSATIQNKYCKKIGSIAFVRFELKNVVLTADTETTIFTNIKIDGTQVAGSQVLLGVITNTTSSISMAVAETGGLVYVNASKDVIATNTLRFEGMLIV